MQLKGKKRPIPQSGSKKTPKNYGVPEHAKAKRARWTD